VNDCQHPLPVALVLARLKQMRETPGQIFLSFAYADGEAGVLAEERKGPDIDPATHRRAAGYQDVNEGSPNPAERHSSRLRAMLATLDT
jgi:hypothetical protein